MEATRAFRGRTTKEVFLAIKEALGEDAIIISTRNIGEARSAQIEVLAAPAQPRATVTLTQSVAPLARSVDPMRQSVAPIRHGVDQATDSVAAVRTSAAPLSEQAHYLDSLRRSFELNGLPTDIGESIIETYRKNASQFAVADTKALEATLEGLQPYGPPQMHSRRAVAMLGPTGVGKTTTIAKLAAIATLKGMTAGMITIDTCRVGAVEQLGSYAALINLPMRSASTAEELRSALLAFSELDRIFIDTAGSSPWDMQRLRELNQILECGVPFERMLLIPASGNAPDLDRIVRTFAALDASRIGVTKIDETCYFGPCFGSIVSAGLPLELFGNGPNVPEDIEYASAKRVLELLSRIRH